MNTLKSMKEDWEKVASRHFKFRAWVGDEMDGTNEKRMSEPFGLIDAERVLNPFWNEPVMQFTGLKDKNGKEIFEADIVKTDWQHDGMTNYDYKMVGEVKMSADTHQWSIEQDKGNEVCIYPFCSFEREELNEETIEIIGNIYENPELISNNLK